MNFFFFFSLPLSSFAISKRYQGTYIYVLFVLFSSEEGKGVSFILSRCNTMQEKVHPLSRERFLKRFISFRINCAFESEAFQNFVVQAAHCRFLCRQTTSQEAALQANCQQTIFPFSIILDLFHETRGQNLWIQDDQVFFSANLIDDKNGKI